MSHALLSPGGLGVPHQVLYPYSTNRKVIRRNYGDAERFIHLSGATWPTEASESTFPQSEATALFNKHHHFYAKLMWISFHTPKLCFMPVPKSLSQKPSGIFYCSLQGNQLTPALSPVDGKALCALWTRRQM